VASAYRCVVPEGDGAHPRHTVAIWAIPAAPLYFAAPRTVAKEFAARVAWSLANLDPHSKQKALQKDIQAA
jgi:hypothetical protein